MKLTDFLLSSFFVLWFLWFILLKFQNKIFKRFHLLILILICFFITAIGGVSIITLADLNTVIQQDMDVVEKDIISLRNEFVDFKNEVLKDKQKIPQHRHRGSYGRVTN